MNEQEIEREEDMTELVDSIGVLMPRERGAKISSSFCEV